MRGTALVLGILAGLAVGRAARAEGEVGAGADGHACGQPNHGRLEGGVRMPEAGDGYRVPVTWRDRGLTFGTRELVTAIQHAAAAVAEQQPGAVLHVADLSWEHGGASGWHASHQNGLDADLIYYAVDEDGAAAPAPASMDERRFDARLRAGKWRLDLSRTWWLVRTLLLDDSIEVRHMFVAAQVEKALLAHAREAGEPDWLVRRADAVMSQSGGAHDDHLHLRIACPAGDRAEGCRDVGEGGAVAKKKAGKKGKGKKAGPAKAAARNGKITKKPSKKKQARR